VGKETDRRWEPGEDLSLFTFKPIEYVPSGKVTADPILRDEITTRGLRELMRTTGLSQHTIEAIREGKPVRRATLKQLQAALSAGSDI
jgi:DNA-binding Xre family transcriptional regulator